LNIVGRFSTSPNPDQRSNSPFDNFLSRAARDHKFKKFMSWELERMANSVAELDMDSLTSKKPTDKPGGGGGGSGGGRGRGAGTKRGQDPDFLGDSPVQDLLKAAGYELTPTDPMLKATMRDATSKDGSRVCPQSR
jgi:hypothetical protein